jgi:hypothetical protein
MEKIPVFNELGVIQPQSFKIPTIIWIALAFIVGSLLTYIFMSSEEKDDDKLFADKTRKIA